MYNIVTIERKFASGGNEIGRKLAEALGYKLYDRNILLEAAKKEAPQGTTIIEIKEFLNADEHKAIAQRIKSMME